MMRACSTAGGAVMFIPDELERKERTQSYKDLSAENGIGKQPEILLDDIVVKKQVAVSVFGRLKKALAG